MIKLNSVNFNLKAAEMGRTYSPVRAQKRGEIMKKSLFIFTLLMITVLALSACSPKGETTEAAASTESVATQPAAAGSCLVGSWSLTDFSAYMNSIEQNTS